MKPQPEDVFFPLVGAQYLIDGIVYEAIQIDDVVVTLSTVTHLRVIWIRLDSFITDLKRRNITLFADKPGAGSNAVAFLNTADPKVTEARRQLQYIRTAIKELGNRLPKNDTLKIIQRIASETQDLHPPGYSTLCRWWSKLRLHNNDEFSLYKIPSTLPRGRVLEQEISEALDKIIDKDFIERDERISIMRICELMDGYVASLNSKRAACLEPLLTSPCYSTVTRRIRKRTGYSTDRNHLGAEAAYKKYRFSGQQERPAAPLDICEVDSHLVDMDVVDKKGRVLGKIAWITLIYDLCTGMVIGWELSLTSPCAEKTLRALRMAVVAVPGEENLRGVMEVLVSDGGSENQNNLVATIADRLSIKWILPPPGSPNTRPRIERFFGTFEAWLHEQHGTTFSNPEECGDYDSARHACFTVEALADYFHEWLEDVYHNTKHKTLNMPPRVAWDRAMQGQLPPRKFTAQAVDALFRGIKYSALAGNRAAFFNLTWTGPNLGTVKAKLHKGEKAICYYDPTDLGVIWVAAPETPRDLVPAWGTKKAYQQGLTLSEHLQLQAQVAADGKEFTDQDAHAALLHLRQRMSEDRENFLARKRKRSSKYNERARQQDSPVEVTPAVEPMSSDEHWDDDIYSPWRVD